ncbi:hypothetical protein FPOAC1_004517 [Fusarium poae]|uniref:DRBM domain-containing protein n=1 Tax=Fusarium poae TaxID=36050 RepID=A0A1B8AT31_FUSPO|nr:hypothetical protein FPOAC1_004517 [Fusarium poae]KAG8671273.1 hypothetical protein FPOAC1_004517 [Fusarium poae]OBS23526.1 hypothetical protein FPOA_04076 [Fusarium poae]
MDTQSTTWQNQLKNVCELNSITHPVFQDFSDRRGGRTAWSSTVTVHGQKVPARFWYDGKNINNAREDAAECAVKWLTGSESGSPTRSQGY